jgi:hypothetical protein
VCERKEWFRGLGDLEGKRIFERHRQRWEQNNNNNNNNNNNWGLKTQNGAAYNKLIWLIVLKFAGCCVNGDELSGSIKC